MRRARIGVLVIAAAVVIILFSQSSSKNRYAETTESRARAAQISKYYLLSARNVNALAVANIPQIHTATIASSLSLATTLALLNPPPPPPPPKPQAISPPKVNYTQSQPAYQPPPSLSQVLYSIRICESSNNYFANTGNGYYGAYQFSLSTWYRLGYSGIPSNAPPATQDQAAVKLYLETGGRAWPICGQ